MSGVPVRDKRALEDMAVAGRRHIFVTLVGIPEDSSAATA